VEAEMELRRPQKISPEMKNDIQVLLNQNRFKRGYGAAALCRDLRATPYSYDKTQLPEQRQVSNFIQYYRKVSNYVIMYKLQF
jgi:hypothetical protein